METQSFWHKPIVHTLGVGLIMATILALASYIYLTYNQAQGVYTGEITISVSGEGEVTAVPDIGQFTFAVQAEGEDATTAQAASAEAMNDILAYLSDAGVADADIKTENYSLQPKYTYAERLCPVGSFCPPGERELDGYEVYQNVVVKVRSTDDAGVLISGVGERGATNISSLEFTIDDPDTLQAEARSLAIAEAREKADALAADLGLSVHKVVGFYEDEGGYYPMQRSGMAMDMAYEESAANPPRLPVGENEIVSRVNVTFELR